MSLERCLLKHRDAFNAQMQKADMLAAKERYMKEGLSAHDASIKAVQDKINALEKSKAALAKGDAVEGMLDRLATRGSTGAEVMDLLAATHPSPYVRALAKHLRKYVADTKFRFGTPAEEAKVLNQTKREGLKADNIAGSYTAVLDTVRLYKPDRLLDTVLHEFVHAASVHALNRAEAFGAAGAAKDLRQLFAVVKETASAEELKLYGFHNAKEFVAEAFVDPDLRDFLKSQPYDTAANMWEAFKNFVAKLLGLPRDTRTLFDRVMELSADIFEENISAKAEYTALRDEPAMVGSDAFKKWFGDSKVVDEGGKPLVVYHGSNTREVTKGYEGFDTFKPSEWGDLGPGIYLTSSAKAASDFALAVRASNKEPTIEKNAHVIPLYVRMETPVPERPPKEWQDWIAKELFKDNGATKGSAYGWRGKYGSGHPDQVKTLDALILKLRKGTATLTDLYGDTKKNGVAPWAQELTEAFAAAGYDGIIHDTGKGFTEYLVFKPEQVKSAIGNSGKYDPTKGDISAMPAKSPVLKTSNPGGDWLKYEQERNTEGGRGEFGQPRRFGAETAWFDDPVKVPMSVLSKLKGLRGEQENVRKDDLEGLKKLMGETGKLPPSSTNPKKEYVPFIMVNQDGEAWVNDGNHRIMAAKALGWTELPVSVKYFSGGELADGPMSPDKLGAVPEVDEGDSDARPVMNATVSQAIGNNPQFIDSLGKLRRGKMYMQFLRDLKDNYGDLLKDANGQPILKKYVDTAFEMGATANELLKSGGDIAERWNELREVKAKVNAIAAEATMAGVHPDIPLTMQDYPSNGRTISNKHLADAKGEFPAEVQEIHARLSNMWKTELNDKGRKVYVDARDHMAKSWDKRRRLLNKRVFDMYEPLIAEALKAGNAGKAREWIRERNAFVREHGKVLAQVKGPYFPLSRFGDYYVVYKSDAYKKLEAEVNEASDALRELYVKYDISAEDKATIDQLAGAGVDVQVLTPETKEAVKIAKERVEKARAELDEMASNGKEYANEAFEAESAATLRAKELGVDVMLKKDYYRQLSPVTEAFLNRIGDAVGGALPEKQANAAREAIVQIWLQSLPDTSAMRSELRRRRVAGFSTDMLRSFSKNAQTNAHYLSRLEHIDDLTSELMAMETASKQPGVPLQGKELYNEMARRHVESLQYSDNPLANALSGIAFVWQLGVSPAFLLTNLSQPWMISMPFMSGRHGVYRSTAELGRAFKDTAAAVSSGIKSGDSKLFFEIDKSLFTKEEQEMLTSAQKDGLLDITLEYDLSAMSKGEQSKISRATRAISAVPHQVEVVNRVMTALAAYRMEVKKTGDAAASTEYAKRVLDKTHIDYSATNAPSFLKPGFMGGFGKVVFQYRKYQLGMLSLLANQMKSALKGSPEAKRALLGMFLMHGTMAGAVGLPLMGSAMFVANLVQNAFGDDDTPWDADVEFRNWLADVFGVEAGAVIAKGVPMLAGIDLSSRVGMSDIGAPIRVLRDNKKGRELWLEVLASGMGPTLGGLAPQMVEAVSLMGSGEMLKGAEKAVPRALADPIKAYRTSSEGVTTGKGVVAVSADRVDTWDTALQALGIPPSILSERAAAVAAVEDAKGELKERRGQLERAYVDARVKGDQDGMADAQAAVAKFNEAQRAKGLPVIKPGDLLTAYKNRKEGEKKMTTQGFTLDKKNKAVGEYGRFADVR